jgi:N-acetyl-anhydromuramyl-L-alanine amidase AmpD
MSATQNFIQARCFHHANRERVDFLVLHTMELPCRPGVARRLGEVFRDLDTSIDPKTGKPKRKPKSAHFGVDPEEIYQYVREADVAWHCPKANSRGIGIEHAGYALPQKDDEGKLIVPATDWTQPAPQAMLARGARLVAQLCRAWNVPAVRLAPSEVIHGARGIVGHVDVTRAFPGSGTHVDPGPRWPWDQYLALVAAELAALG